MKKLLALLLLTLSGSCVAADDEQSQQVRARALPSGKNGLITIKESGHYQLTSDLRSDILIDADQVTIDLNCHTLIGTGENQFYAIQSLDHNHLSVKNGTIANPEKGGVKFLGCSHIHLEELVMHPISVAIVIADSIKNESITDVILHNIDASDNIVSNGAAIFILNGSSVILTNVNLSHCIIPQSISTPQPGALISVQGVDTVTVKCCTVNSNDYQDISFFIPLDIYSCDNVSIEDTKVNGNTASSQTTMDGLYNARIQIGNNFRLKNCQFNEARANQASQCYGLFSALATNIHIECCEAHHTTLYKAVPNSIPNEDLTIGATGIMVVGTAPQHTNLKIHNCSVNETTHVFNQPDQTEFSGPEGIFLLNVNQANLTDCQANDTQVLSGASFLACGFGIASSQNIRIKQCEALRTIVKPQENGQAFGFATFSPNTDISFENCISNGASASTYAHGFISLPDFITDSSEPNLRISYCNCCAQNNTAGRLGSGFLISGNNENCTITECYTQHNSHIGFGIGESGTGKTSLNAHLLRNCAEKNGTGFLINGAGNTIINPILLENKAIDNYNSGFQQIGSVTNTHYIDNKAQGNHPDFDNFINVEGNEVIKGKLTCKGVEHKKKSHQ